MRGRCECGGTGADGSGDEGEDEAKSKRQVEEDC